MSQYKRIFIIGHPGAGKALVAKTLAEKLGWQFINADLGLEFHIGRTLNEILGKHGEKAFHHCASEILANQLQKEKIVVTTDASIVCHEKNRQLLSAEFVVYLQVSTPMQMERTSRNPAPLTNTDLKIFLDKLHQERDSLYDQVASLSIHSDNSALEEHVSTIIKTVLQDKEIKRVTNQLKLDEKDLIFFHRITHTLIHLSHQQAVCLKLLAQGRTSKEIAQEINISYRTVEGHIANTMELLGCSSSKELITLYHDRP
jgi:shikimate kinase